MKTRPVDSVKKLLSGTGVDSVHGRGHRETKNKVKQEQRFEPARRPGQSGAAPPQRYARKFALAEQPASGE